MTDGGVDMEQRGEKAKTEESARGGAGPIGWLGTERGQEARQPTKRSQGWSGQKPQENHCGAAQRAPATAWTPQKGLSVLVEKICARFGDCTIGLGTGGIRYSASAIR